MDGRLKTLHPKVHGGILCRHDNPQDMQTLAEHGILTFELVVVNLYPFEATVARKGVTKEEAIEQIDIGGPTLVEPRPRTTPSPPSPPMPPSIPKSSISCGQRLYDDRVAASPGRRGICANGPLRSRDRRLLRQGPGRRGRWGRVSGHGHNRLEVQNGPPLRREPASASGPLFAIRQPRRNVVAARQLHGKELSYNNLLDLDSALAIVRQFSEPAVVVIKHNNPCGAAVGDTLVAALQRAMEGDPQSAFGSVLGLNRVVDAATADALAAPGLFVEAIVAPHFHDDALQILTTKPKWKNNVRLLEVGELGRSQPHWTFRYLEGGMLMQEADVAVDPEDQWQVVTETQPSEEQMSDPPIRLGDGAARQIERDRVVQGRDAARRRRRPDEPRRFGRDCREEGGRSIERLGNGLRRLLPVPRLDRHGRRRRRSRHHSAGRLEERRRRGRRLQSSRHFHDLHRPAAF